MLGMTEEQFWRSNPAIIKVWEKAWKMEEERKNSLLHAWVGNYGISALCYAIDHVLNGRKAKSKYMKEPLRLFEMTEEEKKQKEKNALAAFVAWADGTKADFDRRNNKK